MFSCQRNANRLHSSKKKDEVNKKALIWSISIVAALVIVTAVLLIVT